MKHLFELPIKKPKLVLLSFLFLGLFFATNTLFVQQAADVSQLVDPHSPVRLQNLKMESIFGNSKLVLIRVTNAFNQESLGKIKAFVDLLGEDEDLVKVTSIYSEKFLKNTGAGFDVSDLVAEVPKTEEEIAELKKKLLEKDIYSGNLIGLDEDSLNLVIEFSKELNEEQMKQRVDTALEKIESDESWSVSGYAMINATFKNMMDRDLEVLIPLVFLVIGLILLVSFKSFEGIVFPILSIIFSILVAVGAMPLLGANLNIVSNAIPIILIAVGTSYGIHYLTQFYIEKNNYPGESKESLISKTSHHIAPTILLTALTTMAGFLSNLASPVKTISEFGVITAFGVIAAAFSAFVMIPAFLRLFHKIKTEGSIERTPAEAHKVKSFSKVDGVINKFLEVNNSAVQRRPIGILLLFVLVVALTPIFIKDITTDYRILGYFSPDSQVVTDARSISKSFGGVLDFNVVVDAKERDAGAKATVLLALQNLSDRLKKRIPELVISTSLGDYVKMMGEAYNGSKKYYRIPEDDVEILQYLDVYSWSGNLQQDLRYVTDQDFRFVRLLGRFQLEELPDGSFREKPIQHYEKIITDEIQQLKKDIGENSKVYFYGDIPLWSTTLSEVVEGQIQSIFLALLVVFLIAFPVLRSAVLCFVALTPIVVSILVIFAAMGLLGIQLDIATSLVSAMSIGIGIDDSLHFLLSFKKYQQKHRDVKMAIELTFKSTGKAILFTTIALVLGYSVLQFSVFSPIRSFGLLNVMAISVATVTTLLAIPAILLLIAPYLDKSIKKEI